MKRVIFGFALAMTAAGVAGTLAFAPVPSASAPQASEARGPVLQVPARQAPTALVSQVASRPPAAPAPVAPTPPKPAVEVRQAPVPLLMKARARVELPGVDSVAVVTPDPAKGGEGASDGSGESAAKAAVEADGYKGVKVLRKGVNGIWHARALRGTTEVSVTVDAQGHVALD